ncbi:hypothetical protein Rleg5DRAFT_1596, partial [Rhizobium leguminosarum bv. viciae WSM1455]
MQRGNYALGSARRHIPLHLQKNELPFSPCAD